MFAVERRPQVSKLLARAGRGDAQEEGVAGPAPPAGGVEDRWSDAGLSLGSGPAHPACKCSPRRTRESRDVVLLALSTLRARPGGDEATQLLRCLQFAGTLWAAVNSDQAEADALFGARRLAYPALERRGPG